MSNAWGKKPCQRCGKVKGPKYAARKYCFRCASVVAKETSEKTHRGIVARVYGIGRDDYDLLYEYQGRRCALCQRATGITRRLCVDHDHVSGAVRGLLCRTCNQILGHARDDPAFFTRAYDYLMMSPARAAGLSNI
jgi:hypothetical protein